MLDLASVLVAASVSAAAALGSLAIARRTGLSDVQRELRQERGALIDTLRARVEHLEGENERLATEISVIKRDNGLLREEVTSLQRHILKMEIGA